MPRQLSECLRLRSASSKLFKVREAFGISLLLFKSICFSEARIHIRTEDRELRSLLTEELKRKPESPLSELSSFN